MVYRLFFKNEYNGIMPRIFMFTKSKAGGVITVKENKGIIKALVMVTQVACTMLAPLLVCGWVGLWLNEKFHTDIAFVIMMFLGIITGFRNFFYLMRQFYEKDLKQENKELEYFESMKKQREQNMKDKNKKGS